jgi:phosphate transport system substrate-binding protein
MRNSISGLAGASFPYPVYTKWADAYKKETGTGLNYQSMAPAAASSKSRPRP